MKKSFQEIRSRYQKLKEKIVDRLSVTGLRILTRSKKIKNIPPEEELFHDQYSEYEYDQTNSASSTIPTINTSLMINEDEYEYDNLDSLDEIDEFEQIDDTRGICDDIHWNVLNATQNSTVFILTKYTLSDQMICSLSDVDPHIKYHHVCEYGLLFPLTLNANPSF